MKYLTIYAQKLIAVIGTTLIMIMKNLFGTLLKVIPLMVIG